MDPDFKGPDLDDRDIAIIQVILSLITLLQQMSHHC